ncbi:short chain dehydrogenase [Popillia japonica]|uniref:Short chain dehydrogenase n=1 Tax=Popillia japonica TaxID=7064 RepID=A0AAW1ITM9_POPJA
MSSEKVAIVTGANKGETAIESLQELGYNPAYHQLDVEDQASVDEFQKYIAKNYGGVDVLVNNAGVKGKGSFGMQATASVGVNYFGTLRMSEAFLPLLRHNANVVNVSSSLGHLAKIPSEELRKKFADPDLTISRLSDLMNEFVRAATEDHNPEKNWGTLPYTVSKVDLNDYRGILTVEEGAVAPLYAALNQDGWKGQFVWRDCTLVDWFGPELPAPY